MSDQSHESASRPTPLPDAPSMEWLRRQAKRRLEALRATTPGARLAGAQLALAREYGFPSWRALKAHVDSRTVEGQLFEAARTGDVARLTALLDAHPDGLHARNRPYAWSLLHVAAHNGHHAAVDLLLRDACNAIRRAPASRCTKVNAPRGRARRAGESATADSPDVGVQVGARVVGEAAAPRVMVPSSGAPAATSQGYPTERG